MTRLVFPSLTFGNPFESCHFQDLGELAATNQAQAASIEAAGTISPEKRRDSVGTCGTPLEVIDG